MSTDEVDLLEALLRSVQRARNPAPARPFVCCGDCTGHRPGTVDKYDGDDECTEQHHPGTPCEIADAARLAGPHRLSCPALGEDPDGIDQCECHDAGVTR